MLFRSLAYRDALESQAFARLVDPTITWTLDDLQELHRLACASTRNPRVRESLGRWRSVQVLTGESACAALPPEVPAVMDVFLAWFRARAACVDAGQASAVQLALDAYLQLDFVHPWSDCNGRTSRALLNALLMRFGVSYTLHWPERADGDAMDALTSMIDTQSRGFNGDRRAFYAQRVAWIAQTAASAGST